MTNDDEFYRWQAREAEEQAERARSDLDRQGSPAQTTPE